MAHALSKKWQSSRKSPNGRSASKTSTRMVNAAHRRTRRAGQCVELRRGNRRAHRCAGRSALLARTRSLLPSRRFHGSPLRRWPSTPSPAVTGFLDANERFLELLGAPREAAELAGGVDFWLDPAIRWADRRRTRGKASPCAISPRASRTCAAASGGRSLVAAENHRPSAAKAIPAAHPPGHHRPRAARNGAAPGAEDGGRGPARRGGRARF